MCQKCVFDNAPLNATRPSTCVHFGVRAMKKTQYNTGNAHSNLLHLNIGLLNTAGLHEGWENILQLEYGNECRLPPSHSFILMQAITRKHSTGMQTVTMRSMWCNPNMNTSLSNTTGSHDG